MTLIETVLVLVLLALVTGFISLSFSQINEKEALDKNADLVVSVLAEARSMTLSSIDDSRYGVHFDANQVVLFRGSSYNSSATTNVPTLLNPLVGIQNISLNGGGSEVVFNRLTGETDNSGSLQIHLKNATTTYLTLTVGATGLSERN